MHYENMRQTQYLVSLLTKFPLNCSFGKCYRKDVIKLCWLCVIYDFFVMHLLRIIVKIVGHHFQFFSQVNI